jgi:hypothetical protein
MASIDYNANRITRFVLPFIVPDKSIISKEYGFVNAYTKTILKKTTIVLVYEYDLNYHDTIHNTLSTLKHFKGHYENLNYEMLEFNIPKDVEGILAFILEGGVYGLPSNEKLKIVNFWGDFSLSYMTELLMDLNEVDVLEVTDIRAEISKEDFYREFFASDEIDELDDYVTKLLGEK